PGTAALGDLEHVYGSRRDRRASAARTRNDLARGMGICVRRARWHRPRCDRWLLGAELSSARSHLARLARRALHRLGAAVHSVVGHLGGAQVYSDGGRRFLSGLPRGDGRVNVVDRKIVEVGRAFRLSGLAMVRRILLPAVMPAYVIALRAGLGLGWMFVLAAEFLGASTGLGFLLIDGPQLRKPAPIVAALGCFAILGKASDWLIVLVSSPFLRWEDRFART